MLIEISLLGPSARGEPPVTPYEGVNPRTSGTQNLGKLPANGEGNPT